MTTLRHPPIVGLPVAFHPSGTRSASRSRVREPSCSPPAHIKPRPRGTRLRAMGHALVIGSEVLLALWATAALGFCIVVIAGLVL
jgi:hypothetical protein